MSAAGAASAPQRLLGTLLLAVLLSALPPSAWAQPEFSVSCEKVTKIRITHISAPMTLVKMPNQGRFHLLTMWLTPEAGDALQALRDATPWEQMRAEDQEFTVKNILVTADGVPLKTASPVWNTLNRRQIVLLIVREEDALEAARRVCPTLEPERLSNERPDQ